ncbi:site-2 protease family protein [Crassaminicella thermophila]|uniref:Site-2 protease family protein n=1 Tax=Crassaminicella thermophila TaxID=2599308 RepID=A0A5C0SB18_CRATE|nr:site-2 protease family protein [Crassaminicella thermophila]QEK10916.1 site-2 protease family protein [Crassaminicella thermophila]
MDVRETLLLIPGIMIGFSFHEYAHAQVAVWLGDDTPKLEGRLSLSPHVHIDPFGFLFILWAGFGWAKPVMINENNFKNPRRDDILVSLAGPVMNLIIALFFLILMKICYNLPIPNNLYTTIMDVFDYTVWINVVLFVFNLLPIPPLDGSHIFFGILGLKEKPFYYEIYTKGRIILPLLIITNLIDKIISPPILNIYHNLVSIFF